MEDLPEPFEARPTGEPVQLTHDQLTKAATFIAFCIDSVDGFLAAAVAQGTLTEAEAADHHDKLIAGYRRRLAAKEAGKYILDPDAVAKLRLVLIGSALDNLERFDRAGRLTVESGELTTEEYAEHRQLLIDHSSHVLDDME